MSDKLVENPATLVFGVIGVGTFIVFFLFLLNIAVWVSSCDSTYT
jgi:hypothetical protein